MSQPPHAVIEQRVLWTSPSGVERDVPNFLSPMNCPKKDTLRIPPLPRR